MSSIITNNKFRNILISIIILLLIFLGLSVRKNNGLKTDLNIAEQNQKALSDSVRISKNKAGEIEFSKNILISKNNDLSKLNSDLASELKKEKGKVSELSKTIAIIKDKPNTVIELPTDLVKYEDGVKGLKWEYDTIFDSKNYRKLKGESQFKINFTPTTYEVVPLTTKLTDYEVGFDFIQGLRETSNGNVEMFVRSNHPGFEAKDLDAVIINPETHPALTKFTKTKQKRFGVGVNVGYGIYVDNFTNRAGFGAQLGVGLTYSIFRF